MRDIEIKQKVNVKNVVPEIQYGTIQITKQMVTVYHDLENDKELIDYATAASFGFIGDNLYNSRPDGYYVISQKQLMWIIEKGFEIKYIEWQRQRNRERVFESIDDNYLNNKNEKNINNKFENQVNSQEFEVKNNQLDKLKEFREEVINQYSDNLNYDNFKPKKL